MAPHPPPPGPALHSAQTRRRPWSTGGQASKPRLDGKSPRGAGLRTWTAYFPGLLLCVNGPHPPQALPTSRLPLVKRPWATEARAAGGVSGGEGTRPAAPGRPLGAALCSPRGTRGGRGAAPGARASNKESGGTRPAPPPRPSPCFARGGCGAENKGTGRGRGRRVSRAGQSARPRPRAREGARCERRGPGWAVSSAPTCPLALAGEAPAASSAVTSPRGALELWLPMMGVCWGAPGAAPGSRRRG